MDNSQSFFLCFVIIIVILSYLADKFNSKLLLIMIIAVLSFYSGLRNVSVGIDTREYYSIINAAETGGINYIKDKGFLTICRILLSIFKKPEILILCFSIIICVFIICRMWELRNGYSFAFMVFIFMGCYYLNTLNITRQYITVGILFFSVKFLEKQHYIIFAIIVLLLSVIHLSALLGFGILLIFLIKDYHNNTKARKLLLISIPIVLIGGIFVFFRYFPKYEHYFSKKINSGVGLMQFVKIALILLVLVCSKAIRNNHFSKDKDGYYRTLNTRFLDLYVLGIGFSFLGYYFSYMDRIGLGYLIFEIPFWGQVAKSTVNKYLYCIAIGVIVVYDLLYSVIQNGYGVFPYSTIFN